MCRPTPKTNFTKCLPIIILFFTALRILAGLRIPYMILADQRYDDRMLFENAYDLLSGVWLGSYDAYALAKGIGYPMFLVLAKKLCLPYSVLLALLQAVGAWLFVRALSVRWKNPYGQTLLYLLLLFSPISLTQLVTQRLYRMAIVPGMVLVVFSGMIGLTLRKELPLKKQLPWAVLTGMALAFFWQIREDSVWILPFIAVMTAINGRIQTESSRICQKKARAMPVRTAQGSCFFKGSSLRRVRPIMPENTTSTIPGTIAIRYRRCVTSCVRLMGENNRSRYRSVCP